MTNPSSIDAIVLAGGRGSRLGGADKAALELSGERLVVRTVHAVHKAGADRIVIVGPRSADVEGATTVREDPPFSGPLAALGAGIDALQDHAAEWILLLSCDLVDPAAVCRMLIRALPDPGDGAVLIDPDGRTQWLAGIHRSDSLRSRLAALRADCTTDGTDGTEGEDPLVNQPIKLAFAGASLSRLPAPAATTADIDTPEDLVAACLAHASDRGGSPD